jgi:nitroreductase
MSEMLHALTARRARRAYDSRAVPIAVQERLWKAVSLAPSHGNTQPTRLLVAETPETRESLFRALSEGNRSWAGAAPLLVAIVANPAHDTVQTNSDGSERELWALHVGIALGNLLAQATEDGLVAHPMAGFDEPAVRACFALPPSIRVASVVAIGYPGDPASLPEDLRARETMEQDRLPLENLAGGHWHEGLAMSARDWRKQNRA